jgi:hypothetical protein
MKLTSPKSKAGDANTIDATSDNIKALGDKIRIHIGPCEACSNLDSLRIFADCDVFEPGHRDVYTLS